MSNGAMKIEIDLKDVWDWAYCPLRVWWRKTGLAPDVISKQGKRTGEQLIEESIRSATRVYYELAGKSKDVPFGKCLGLVWKGWLEAWRLDDETVSDLVNYHQTRRSILSRFEDGEITNREGERYKKPTWTRYWRRMAESSGLAVLRQNIDRHQEAVGLGRLELPEEEYYRAPKGLADAFADSMDYANKMRLPPPDVVLGVNERLEVELPSVRLFSRADIVRSKGVSRKRGRPPKEPTGENLLHRLEYEIFLFDEEAPPIYGLLRDLRVIALGQSFPINLKLEEGDQLVESIRIRHMPSGKDQEINPRLGDGADILEALSRAVITGIRAGNYVPRMVCGWRACGDCQYRMLCFSETGVMDAFNPPLMAQIESAQRLTREMRKYLGGDGAQEKRIEIVRSIFEFMAKSPDLTPEGALWAMDNLEAETG
ncbi:MAG: hypothetical protein P1P76_09860 [Anaerolineales bacterium]|nr:hypothetical protein [Anaerolineales bacterium]